MVPVLACEDDVPSLWGVLDDASAVLSVPSAAPPFAPLAPFAADLGCVDCEAALFWAEAYAADCADCADCPDWAACCCACTLCCRVCANGAAPCAFAPEEALADEVLGVPERDTRKEMGDMVMP